MTIDFKALGAAVAAENNIDMTKAQVRTELPPLAAGPCRLRFVGYVELGKQNDSYQGKPVVKEKVRLFFEVLGKKHPPRITSDGKEIPNVISFEENFSLNEKANFFKLFNRMNYAGDAVHMVQLLGRAYKGEIVHREYDRKGGGKGVAVELHSKERGYLIDPPRIEDPETGDWRDVPVPPPTVPIKVFLWNKPSKEQWGSIFIDGVWPARTDESGKVVKPERSKNELQDAIRAAVNFKGSPIEVLLQGSEQLDLPAAEKAKPKADPLDGLGDDE